jgi:Undecaprenyl-phosphate galactose phosphotransferase WbaP
MMALSEKEVASWNLLECSQQLHGTLGRDKRLSRAGATALQVSILLFCDLVAVVVAAISAYQVWAKMLLMQPISIYLELTPLLFVFPLSYSVAGLYPGFGLGAVETLRRLFHCTNVSFLVIAAATFVFKADSVYSRMTFAIFWLAALLIVPMARLLTLSMVSRFRWWGEPAIIFGRTQEAELVMSLLRRTFSLGYRVVGVISQGERAKTVQGVPVLGGSEMLPAVSRLGVSTCLVWDRSDDFAHILAPSYQRWFRHVVLLRDWRSLPIEHVKLRNLGGVLGIDLPGSLLNRRNQAVKRAIDLVLGTLLTVISAPIVLLFGVLVKLASPGPMFFAQYREGSGGKNFCVWKLRTMHPDAEERLASCLRSDPHLARQWQQKVKLVPDPRIIPFVGTFMRRFSIDEIPQLLSVVTGKMSLVGPRPLPEYHLSRFSETFRGFRNAVRPGLTGMWQVMIRSQGNLEQQEMYDTYYIRNWSLLLDVYILCKTVVAVFSARGAS